jgi:hypothetical protein
MQRGLEASSRIRGVIPMKITVEKHWGSTWSVVLNQGCQTFYMDKESRQEARWYAKMFRIALNNHDIEQRAKERQRRMNEIF